ncbi:MAG TPA: ice-binding family protein [Candidatus Acidoferrum sp.]|nr:ice-binding family protein [Candidatus Acidoferrum sp.]
MKTPLISFNVLALILLSFAPRALADDILGPDLSTFAVLGGTPVVSFAAGNDTIAGNVGVSPAASITIASPLTFTLTGGTQHAGDATAAMAQAGLTNALTVLGGLASVGTAQSNLNAVSLNPGVYNIGAADLTGTLTLTNTLGVTNPSWVFIGSSLTSSGVVMFAPGLNAANAGVYWDIGSSATLSGVMLGNVLAGTSITTTGVTDSCGRLLASTGDVTFAGDNTISDTCAASISGLNGGTGGTGGTGGNGGGGGTTGVPEPATFTLLLAGLLPLGLLTLRKLQGGC